MSRIKSTIAAALAASPLLIAEPGWAKTAPAPETAPQADSAPLPPPNELTLGCKLYSNTLALMEEAHITGKLVLTPRELAQNGARGILEAAHIYVLSHAGRDAEASSRISMNEPDQPINASWTVRGETIEAKAPSEEIPTNLEACSYLSDVVLKASQLSGAPIFDLFEAATAEATRKAIPKETHTSYEVHERAADNNQQMRGEFGGVGIQIQKTPGEPLLAEKVVKDGPSQKAGVLDGDKITHVNGQSILPLNAQEVVSLLRGPANTEVKLTIQRGEGAPLDLSVTRSIIVQRAVEGFWLEGSEVGVITISTFVNQKATIQFMETALEVAKKAYEQGKSIKHFVVRVEENGGGLLDQGIKISDLIVDSESDLLRRIVSIGKSPDKIGEVYFAEQAMRFNLASYLKRKMPQDANIESFTVSVLQNGGSASASEIFAGAAQDAGFSVIGTRSYGKGTVQNIIPLAKDGTPASSEAAAYGSLRVTIFAFFPGSGPAKRPVMGPGSPLLNRQAPAISGVGKSNLGSGIVPDILVRTGDWRDQQEDSRPREQAGLLDAGHTRESDKPASVCTVRPEFRGELSGEVLAQVPEQFVVLYPKRDNLTGAWTRVRMLDANLACAVELHYDTDKPFVDFAPYQAPEPTPAPSAP